MTNPSEQEIADVDTAERNLDATAEFLLREGYCVLADHVRKMGRKLNHGRPPDRDTLTNLTPLRREVGNARLEIERLEKTIGRKAATEGVYAAFKDKAGYPGSIEQFKTLLGKCSIEAEIVRSNGLHERYW